MSIIWNFKTPVRDQIDKEFGHQKRQQLAEDFEIVIDQFDKEFGHQKRQQLAEDFEIVIL